MKRAVRMARGEEQPGADLFKATTTALRLEVCYKLPLEHPEGRATTVENQTNHQTFTILRSLPSRLVPKANS